MTNKRGGYRKGAGRPINSGKHGKPTTVVRVPCDFDFQQFQERFDALEKNLEIRNLALHWLANGGACRAAQSALFHILGIHQQDHFKSYPCDSSDFECVLEMIDAVCLPEHVGSLATLGKEWAALVGVWATLERLISSGDMDQAQKAHQLMWAAYEKTKMKDI